MEKVDILKRLTSAAKHDGNVFPSGGRPPNAHIKSLLLDAAREIRTIRVPVRPTLQRK